jgi:hypothetical protein
VQRALERQATVDEMLFLAYPAMCSATASTHLQAAVVVARVAKAASGPVTDALEPLHEALAMAPAAGKVCTSLPIVRCTTSRDHCGHGVIVEILRTCAVWHANAVQLPSVRGPCNTRRCGSGRRRC